MIEKSKKLIPFIVSTAAALSLPAAVNAQSLVPTELTKHGDIIPVIRGIIQFVLIVAFIIAFVMLLIGGIRWILAGGDEKSVEKARNTITAALIGLVIILVAFALIRLVEQFFGVTIISGSFTVPTIGT